MEDEVQPLKNFKSLNTIPFPALDEQSDKSDPEPQDDDQSSSQDYGCKKKQRPPEKAYKAMNKGLAALTKRKMNQQMNQWKSSLKTIMNFQNISMIFCWM
jgi:hypothetical protein